MESPKPMKNIVACFNRAKHFGRQFPEKMCEAPEWDREEFLESIDFDHLISVCSSLRNGIRCRIADEYLGDENLVYEVKFEDDWCCIARIPMLFRKYHCDDPVLEGEVRAYLFKSMIAAQTYARTKKDV